MISQSLIVSFLLRPTAKLFAFLRSCVLLNTFATGFFTRCFFHLAVQFSKYILRPSRFARWLPARIFQILCAFRFAFAHPPKVRFSLFAIPENDTGSRRRTVIRPLGVSLRGFFASSAFSTFVLHRLTFVCLYRPGMNLRVSSSILSLERR